MMVNSRDFIIHTFGCKVNTYDSGLLQKHLTGANFIENKDLGKTGSGIHVLNTCAVTQEATREAVRTIRRIKSKNPFATVVVTGCAAQVDTGSFENLPGADLVVANSHKALLPQILDQFFKGQISEKVFKSNIFKKEDLGEGGGVESAHTRTFLKIQDGCNSFCTYCIIPFARGKSQSLKIADLVAKVNELYAVGVREVVLTGVHIGDYEDDVAGGKKSLEDLVEAMLAKTQMPRFRLSSLEPVELTSRLLELYRNNSRLCPHFHMSIQSANTDVLGKMKRNYGQKEVVECLTRIRQVLPHAHIGMDVIVGFPTETEEQFEDTYLTLANLPWSRIHVFPYSEREGTKAAKFEETVPKNMRQIRASRLRSLSSLRVVEELKKQIGIQKSVLVLKSKAKGGQGLTEDYWHVDLGEQEFPASTVLSVEIKGFEMKTETDGYLIGEVVEVIKAGSVQ
ncbi:MAG: tRNA (N(6)-L-threonylcarbamoyladenosine(37)-C(2))-methylthiotransferase MtaB [Pseudobdellovibrionaceae bacterium]